MTLGYIEWRFFIKKYCIFPFETVEISADKNLYFCCPTWLNKPIGNFEKNTLEASWNSKSAQEIRESIIEGSYKFCDHDLCPYLQSKKLKTYNQLSFEQRKYFNQKMIAMDQMPKKLMLSYDRSCNLSCESCRIEKISYDTESSEFRTLKKLTDKFTSDFLAIKDREMCLSITGSGDPFGSAVFRQFLENLNGDDYPNLRIDLQTNGVLLTEITWERMKKIHKNIGHVLISVDAATEASYNLIRRGGNWKQLLRNIDFLRKIRSNGEFKLLQVNMVVQKRNYFEMIEFIDLFNQVGIDTIYFSLISDWQTWSEELFNQQAIWQKNHPDFENFLEILANPKFFDRKIELGNLTQYRNEALIREINKKAKLERMRLNFRNYLLRYRTKFLNLFILIRKIVKRERKFFIS